ncbi:MAG: FecR domain-containing protein [Cytophagales bacterium]|nr:FecR domain-containing protein [Cytophagales bacterium]
MTEELFNRLVYKSFNNEASVEEEKQLKEILDNSAELKEEYQLHKALWQETRLKERFDNQEKTYKRIKSNIGSKRTFNINTYVKYSARIAATILIILAFIFLFENNPSTEKKVENKTITNITKKRQRSTVQLPDGSIAWLNVNSKIDYKQHFGDKNRIINLEGEAIFQVVKENDRPFIVKTRRGEVKVLGTTFSARNYETDAFIQVALLEGKVHFANSGYEQTLEPGEVLLGKRDGAGNLSFEKRKSDVANMMLWKEGILNIDNETIEEVVRRLEHWYGVEIILKGHKQVKHLTYNGRFANESIKNVLESLRYTRKFEYTITGDRITIDFTK